MEKKKLLQEFSKQLIDNLSENILPYWMERMKDPCGGYFGRRDGHDSLVADAPKGAILHARILWTFSAAYNATHNPDYLMEARYAYEYIMSHFIDKEFGGVFWSLNSDGEPLDTKKQYYAIAFTIYGLSEYYLASGEEEALDMAYLLFLDIENHARDMEKGGYIEASTRDWQPIEDMRLSDHDANASKTMNTHLHILEGYTALLWALRKRDQLTGINQDEINQEKVHRVTEATTSLLNIFFDRIENPKTHHLTLFFDDDWQKYDDAESYGHDIEASWLLLETAEVIGDTELYQKALSHTARIALAALDGRKEDGSMVYELHEDGTLDADRHWWVQAENVIGQLYMARFHSVPSSIEMKMWLEMAWQSWRYIADNLVDPTGEWYWSRKADGTINRDDDKAGFWKCPYHNSRMCLESTRILSQLD